MYFIVLNIHVRHRSQLCSINVELAAPYMLVVKHDIYVIVKPVVSYILTLETTGFTVQITSATVEVEAIFVAFSGDNLSVNRLSVLTCCFTKGHLCRF